jgi:hypothetical protein
VPRPNQSPLRAFLHPFGEDLTTTPLNFELVFRRVGLRRVQLTLGEYLSPCRSAIIHKAKPNEVSQLLRVPVNVVIQRVQSLSLEGPHKDPSHQ